MADVGTPRRQTDHRIGFAHESPVRNWRRSPSVVSLETCAGGADRLLYVADRPKAAALVGWYRMETFPFRAMPPAAPTARGRFMLVDSFYAVYQTPSRARCARFSLSTKPWVPPVPAASFYVLAVSACRSSHAWSSVTGISLRRPIRTSRTSGSMCARQVSQETPNASQASSTLRARVGTLRLAAPRSGALDDEVVPMEPAGTLLAPTGQRPSRSTHGYTGVTTGSRRALTLQLPPRELARGASRYL